MTASAAPPREGAELLAARVAPRGQLRVNDVLYRLYLGAVFAPLAVVALSQPVELAVRLAGLQPPLGGDGVPAVLAVVTVAALTALVTLLRTAVWHGPVVVGTADVMWLLASPRPRAELLRPRLASTLRRSVLAGGIVGALVGVLAAEVLGAVSPVRGVAGAAAGAAVALIGQAAAWWVAASASRARLVVRATPFAVGAVLVAAGVAVVAPASVWALAWSGPWGWAALVVGGPAWTAAPAAVLLALCAAGTTRWALRRADHVPIEELDRRSTAATGVAAALVTGDVQGAGENAREAVDALRGPIRVRLPAPRSSSMALRWRDATVALRSPVVLVAGLGLAIAAGAAVSVGLAAVGQLEPGAAPDAGVAGAVVLLPLGALFAMGAARTLLAALRTAIAQPFGFLLLPWNDRELLRRHLALPTEAATTGALLGVALVALVAATTDGAAAVIVSPRALMAGVVWVLATMPAVVVLTVASFLRAPSDPTQTAGEIAGETMAAQRALLAALRSARPALALLLPTLLLPAVMNAPTTTLAWLPATLALGCGVAARPLAWMWLRRRPLPWE